MSFPKLLIGLSIVLFGSIFVVSYFKDRDKKSDTHQELNLAFEPLEVDLEKEINEEELPQEPPLFTESLKEEPAPFQEKKEEALFASNEEEVQVDRIAEFFSKREPRFPVVETIIYKSRVPWHKGRPAWVSDYASHYKTSRHFIARSLNGRPDYEKQDVKEGDRFNVLKEDKDFEFYLLTDLLSGRMRFYYIDHDTNEKVLVKSYRVGIGRPDPDSASGHLTPLGKYTLGSKVAVYRPKMQGIHQGEKIEMVRVFGTRWIPFGEEVEDCTEPAKGFGIHGLPLLPDGSGNMAENVESLGKYESDGCIRMATSDIEELFSIIITRPTTIEIVRGFQNAKLKE